MTAATAIGVAATGVAVIADPNDTTVGLVSDISVTTLPNGLTVATERVPGTLSVATGVWVGVGARDEAASVSGVSHFLEHLIFKGTAERSALDVSRAVDRVGGDFNAFTAKEYTAYYCRVPARHMEMAVDLVGDVVGRPALRPDDIESERAVILEELAMDDDSPDDVAHRAFMAQLFPRHPLGRDTAGERETVASIRPSDVHAFFAEHYRAGAMVLSIAGPASHDEMRAAAVRAFEGLAAGDASPRRAAPGPMGDDVVIDDDTEQVHLVLGYRGLDRTDVDREALDVVNQVLGGGLSSRLFTAVREERGLAYSIFSSVSSFADAGAFTIDTATRPEQLAELRGVVRDELAKLRANGITPDERDVAVGYLCGAFELGLEDTGSRMARTATSLVTLGEVRSPGEQVARWQAVTVEDANRVIERVLAGPQLCVAVGPAS